MLVAFWLTQLRNVGKSTLYNTLRDPAELMLAGFSQIDSVCP